jgi:hypothetical protein
MTAVDTIAQSGSVSGLIIDTPASFAAPLNGKSGSGEKYAFIKTCVDLFKSQILIASLLLFSINSLLLVNVIVVIGHEKLNVEMRREFGPSLAVVKIPKSGGVSVRRFLLVYQMLIMFIRSSNWTMHIERECTVYNYIPTYMVNPFLYRQVYRQPVLEERHWKSSPFRHIH